MRCPYCINEVHDKAVVCHHCGRDLLFFRPLLERVEKLEDEIKTLRADAARRAERAAERREAGADRPEVAVASAPAPGYWTRVVSALIVCIAGLVLAHVLVVLLYDLNSVWLRAASIVLPIPFGYAMVVRHPSRVVLSFVLAVLASLLAVFAMASLTAMVDHVPVLPDNERDWREVGEYCVSIVLAFLTGMLLAKFALRRRGGGGNPVARVIVEFFSPGDRGEASIQRAAKRLTETVEMLTPIATALFSVVAGLKALIK